MAYQPVDFSSRGAPGFRVSEMFTVGPSVIDHAGDHVLQQAGTVRVLIKWPGYSTSDTFLIPQPITRGALARLLTRAYAAFFQKIGQMACDRSLPGWRVGVGQGAIAVNDLVIREMGYVPEGDVWRVGVEVGAERE